MLEAREFKPEENNSIVVHVTVPFENDKRTISRKLTASRTQAEIDEFEPKRGLIAPCAYLFVDFGNFLSRFGT